MPLKALHKVGFYNLLSDCLTSFEEIVFAKLSGVILESNGENNETEREREMEWRTETERERVEGRDGARKKIN